MATGRKFAVFDIDGTLIRWQLYHAVADNLIKNGVVSGQRFDSIRGARMDWKRRAPGASFKSYETQVVQAYEEALAQLTAPQLSQAVKEVFEEYKDQVYTYTRDLIADLKSKNYLLFAISGSQTEIVELVAAYYGFDAFIGTEYTQKAGRFTGEKIFHAQYKDRALQRLVKRYQATLDGSIGIGDSYSDVAMLKLVEQPIAFNPEQALFEYAAEQGWRVVIERKNIVYELKKAGKKYELVAPNS